MLASATALALPASLAHAADKLPVTASFSILGDLVRVVGGDRVTLVHTGWARSRCPCVRGQALRRQSILGSKLLVTNGLGFEPWAGKLAKSAGYQGQIRGRLQRRARAAPWPTSTDMQNPTPTPGKTRTTWCFMCATSPRALSRVDPAGASAYQANAEAYVKELQALDSWAKEQFATIPAEKRKVITSHDAFGYFAAHYRIQFVAPQASPPKPNPVPNRSPSSSGSFSAKNQGGFLENMSNPKLLAQLSKDAGVTLGTALYADALSAPGKPGSTYLQMVRHNVTQLAAGMKLN
ncbi:MAG: zinc ABC transporter substrate-binding protein [Rhodoferax sp.]|nr:zinc ABC transporter substrate-binding protein [Rhodoferax sp.]